MIREARARLAAWWRPTLTVPALQPRVPDRPLPEICGLVRAGRVVVVTKLGTEIPIHRARGWSVVAFTKTLAQIEGLPEVEPGSWRA